MRIWKKLIGTATVLTVVLTAMTASIASAQDSEPQDPPCPDEFAEDLMDYLKIQVGFCQPLDTDPDGVRVSASPNQNNAPVTNSPLTTNSPVVPILTGGRYDFATYYCPANPGPGAPEACRTDFSYYAGDGSSVCEETWLCDEEYARPNPTPTSYEIWLDDHGNNCGQDRTNCHYQGTFCHEDTTFTSNCEIKTDSGRFNEARFEREFCWLEDMTTTTLKWVNGVLTPVTETVATRVCNISLDEPALN